jgi:hypothetical protein
MYHHPCNNVQPIKNKHRVTAKKSSRSRKAKVARRVVRAAGGRHRQHARTRVAGEQVHLAVRVGVIVAALIDRRRREGAGSTFQADPETKPVGSGLTDHNYATEVTVQWTEITVQYLTL